MRGNDDTRRQARAWQCVLAASAAALCAGQASGATVDWSASAGTTSWSTPANWMTGVLPANDLLSDTARFNQTSYANLPDAGTTSVSGIVIGDGTTATAALTLSGTQLTLGIGGINMLANAGPVTFSTPVTLGTGQTWANASSSTLAINGAVTRTVGKTLNIQITGSGPITSSTLTNDSTGIIGPWATMGSGIGTRYVAMSGPGVGAYNGGTAITSANINANMTSATTNYDYNSGNATIGTSLTGNTLRNVSAGSVTLSLSTANPTVTLNGVLDTGGSFTIGNATGAAGAVVIGSSNELVLIAANNNIAINAPIWNSGSTGGVGGTPGSITVAGPNSVIFGQNLTNTFSGSVTVNSGTLRVSYNQTNPNVSTFTLNSGTVDLGSNSLVGALGVGPLTINGGTLTKTGGSGNTYSVSSQTWNGDFAITGGNKLAFAGPVTLGRNITVNVTNTGGFGVPGAIGDGGNGYAITKTGSGVLYLNGSGSTFSGPVNVLAGEVNLAAGTTNSPVLNSGHVVNLNLGAILGIASTLSGSTDTIGGVNDGPDGGGTVRNGTTSARTVILAGAGNYNFSGAIANATGGSALNVSKTGSGTQVLSGTNTYTGATTLTGGLLRVDGSLAATAVAVNAGGRLGGKGSIAGRVTVAGGSASRGALDLRDGATGTLSLTGNLTTTGTAGNYTEMFLELSGLTSDTIAITGTPTIGAGGIKINVNALGDLQGGDYVLMTAAGGLGTGNITLANDSLVYGGKTYTFSLAASSSTAEILTVVIPEPSILGGLMIGAVGMLARRRRRL